MFEEGAVCVFWCFLVGFLVLLKGFLCCFFVFFCVSEGFFVFFVLFFVLLKGFLCLKQI